MTQNDYLGELIDTHSQYPEFANQWATADLQLHLIRSRVEAGLTQATIAAQMNLTQPQIARLEKNFLTAKFEKVLRYAEIVGLKLSLTPQGSPAPSQNSPRKPRGSYQRQPSTPLTVNEKRPDSN